MISHIHSQIDITTIMIIRWSPSNVLVDKSGRWGEESLKWGPNTLLQIQKSNVARCTVMHKYKNMLSINYFFFLILCYQNISFKSMLTQMDKRNVEIRSRQVRHEVLMATVKCGKYIMAISGSIHNTAYISPGDRGHSLTNNARTFLVSIYSKTCLDNAREVQSCQHRLVNGM